jgi:hypothetical protein
MSRRWPFVAGMLALTLLAVVSSGCVDRRFIIESAPPNANVFVNNKLVGATPVDVQFTYYGKYRFTFVRDGYQTLTVDEDICPPWYEYFPIEFIAENLWPFTVRDIHYIRRPLEMIPIIPPEAIKARGDEIRAKGQAIGVPLPPEPGKALPPAVVVPPQ